MAVASTAALAVLVLLSAGPTSAAPIPGDKMTSPGYTGSGMGPFSVSEQNSGSNPIQNEFFQFGGGIDITGGSITSGPGATFTPNGNGPGTGEFNWSPPLPPGATVTLILNTDGTVTCGTPLTGGFTSTNDPSTYTPFSFAFAGSCGGPTPTPTPGTSPQPFTIGDATAVLNPLIFVDPRAPNVVLIGDVTNPTEAPVYSGLAIIAATGIFFSVEQPYASAAKKPHSKPVIVGSSTGTIPAGKTITLKVMLTRKAVAYIKKHKTLPVTITLDLSDTTGHHKAFSKRATLKLKKK